MLAGMLLGTTEAGLLRLAREFSSVLSNPANLIRQVLYLDLTRSWHQGGTDIKSLAYLTAAVAAGLGFVFVLLSFMFGDLLLEVFVGTAYIGAWHLLTLMLLAATFEITASSLRSASYAIGEAAKVLHLYTISSVIYISCFVGFTWWLGLIGAGIAASLASIVPPAFMFVMIHKSKIEPNLT
jgi:O-antigen/teichoic acid export membrane protein